MHFVFGEEEQGDGIGMMGTYIRAFMRCLFDCLQKFDHL